MIQISGWLITFSSIFSLCLGMIEGSDSLITIGLILMALACVMGKLLEMEDEKKYSISLDRDIENLKNEIRSLKK